MTAADADRAKAAELVGRYWEHDAPDRAVEEVAVALAEARAPYDRLTADLRELAEELDRDSGMVHNPETQAQRRIARRLRGLTASSEETNQCGS